MPKRKLTWEKHDVMPCCCPASEKPHKHCPCINCNGKAVHRSTEERHRKEFAESFGIDNEVELNSADEEEEIESNTSFDTELNEEVQTDEEQQEPSLEDDIHQEFSSTDNVHDYHHDDGNSSHENSIYEFEIQTANDDDPDVDNHRMAEMESFIAEANINHQQQLDIQLHEGGEEENNNR